MHVLLLNGSPNADGCTFTALSEIAATLKTENITSEIFQLGKKPVRGCIACGACRERGECAFQDDALPALVEAVKRSDGIVIGSPVYYAGPNGALCALLDRLFFSAGELLKFKPGAAVVSCRRGGASASFDRLNKYFTINQMPVVSSQYWNSVHGFTADDVRKDAEGLQTMRTLAHNLARMLRMEDVTPKRTDEEEHLWTSFHDGK
ncbi:MAG: flavodoxin family protein [Lentisphaeria bacterium]|nr:flavodoxin family protein [Lentisphaeria bacterium]